MTLREVREEIVSKLKNISIEVIQSEEQREKKIEKNNL